jgi:general secretion pathway protein A
LDLAQYELRAKPFQLNSDPEFLWLGEPYKEAFATLHAAVLDNRGVLLLTGDVGSGKTILINALVERLLAERTIVARLPYPNLEPADFFSVVANACDVPRGFAGRAAFLMSFRRFVRDAEATGRRVLLVIDEAQSLTPSLFAEIERLADAGTYAGSPPKHLANILLAGQDHLCSVLLRSEHARLAQAINVRCDLRPLTEAEVGEYIAHRVKVAGTERPLFTAGAVRKIWALSGGSPGLINLLSHRQYPGADGRRDRSRRAHRRRSVAGCGAGQENGAGSGSDRNGRAREDGRVVVRGWRRADRCCVARSGIAVAGPTPRRRAP